MKVFALGRYSSRNVFAGVSLDYSSHGTHSSLSFIHNASVYRYAQLLVDELLFTFVSPAQLLLLSFLLANLDANPSLQLKDPLCQDLLLWILHSVHSFSYCDVFTSRSQLLLLSGDRLQCNQTILNQRYEESEEGKKLCMFIEAIGTCLSVVASQASGPF